MGLYQNRIVVKVGTSTLTNEMGKAISARSTDLPACYPTFKTWGMK